MSSSAVLPFALWERVVGRGDRQPVGGVLLRMAQWEWGMETGFLGPKESLCMSFWE